MKKHYPFSIFIFIFLVLNTKAGSQVLFNESFPNSANTSFGLGPGSYTFNGDLGTWNVAANDANATGAVTGPPSFSSPNSIVIANYINNTAGVSLAEFSSPSLNLSPYNMLGANINLGFRVNTTGVSGTNSCLTYTVQFFDGTGFLPASWSMTAQQLVSTYGTGWGVVSVNIPQAALNNGFKVFFTGFNGAGCNVSNQFLYIDDVQIVNGNVTLPVNLLSFSLFHDNLGAHLKWSAEESNTSFYSIERSNDGKSFIQIGTVQALNNNKADYSFTDKLASYQLSSAFYRLSIKDVDGRTTYSKILFLRIASSFEKEMMITPNPASAVPNIILQASKQGVTNIEVFDALGKRKLLQRVSLSKGTNSILLNNTGELVKGIYIVRVTIDGTSQSAKLIIR